MKRADKQPETVTVMIYAGIYTKVYTVADADTLLPQHAHYFDHQTILAAGSIEVWTDDKLLGSWSAPHVLQIPAHTKHAFRTLTPGVTLMCIHNAYGLEGDEPIVSEEHQLVEEK